MAGITRYLIEDDINGAGRWRFQRAKELWPAAIALYRDIFDRLGAPLAPGYEEILIAKRDFEAGYDRFLGIDVLLKFENGMESTLQEKFLFTRWKTVTVEYMQNPQTGEEGDWFKLKAQYYFVGYDRTHALTFQDWILLNWPYSQLATLRNEIQWGQRDNQHDGAQANFKHAHFDQFPGYCKVADSEDWLNEFALVLPGFEGVMRG